MARALLTLAGLLGGGAVFIAGLNAHNPLEALRAIAAGVGLLVFVAGVGLADLIDIARQTPRRERRQAIQADEGQPPNRRG